MIWGQNTLTGGHGTHGGYSVSGGTSGFQGIGKNKYRKAKISKILNIVKPILYSTDGSYGTISFGGTSITGSYGTSSFSSYSGTGFVPWYKTLDRKKKIKNIFQISVGSAHYQKWTSK